MWRRTAACLAAIVALATLVMLYPVGGQVWSTGQVDRLALVRGDLRSETDSQVAIQEALQGVRADRLRRVLSFVTQRRCYPRDLEFHTQTGWVAARVHCPSGFFLDFIRPPQ